MRGRVCLCGVAASGCVGGGEAAEAARNARSNQVKNSPAHICVWEAWCVLLCGVLGVEGGGGG